MNTKEYHKLYRESHKEQFSTYNKKWYQKNLERLQIYRGTTAYKANKARQARLRKFNLTEEQYNILLERQGNSCAICKTTEPGGRGSWHTDHDTACCSSKAQSCGKCIRGLLCHWCNLGLGNFKDNVLSLRAAADYLEAQMDR